MSELRKSISVWQGIALAVGMVVGSGLLALPGLTLETGIGSSTAGWLITSVAAIPFIFIFSRLGLRFTSSAGLTLYAKKGAGEWAGHAVTAVLVGTFVLGIPAIALIGAAYAQHLLGFPTSAAPWIAIAILGATTLVNLLGVRVAGWVNSASLLALLALVAIIVLMNPGYCLSGLAVVPELASGRVDLQYMDVWKVCVLLFWAYLGWENLSFGLEEFRQPRRTIPLVYWGSFAVVVILYLALALTSIGAAATGKAISGASGLVALVSGSIAGTLIVAVMLLVILANANSWVFGASRLVFSAGRDGVLFPVFARLSSRDVPWVSLLTLFAAYTAVIIGTHLLNVTVSTIIPLVSQNFLVLYVFSILAFWRTETGLLRWVVTLPALALSIFFLSGFSWWTAYPAALLAIGYVSYLRSKSKTSRQEQEPYSEVHT